MLNAEPTKGTVPLRAIAYSRSGDKGNISNVSVIAHEAKDWDLIRDQVTVEAVARIYAGLYDGKITRYELPGTRALNFVIEGALAGGVSVSLRVDPHGKSMQSLVLGLEIQTN